MAKVEWPLGTDPLLDEVLTDAHSDDEQLWALHQALVDGVALPVDGFVVGEPVSVIGFDYDGNARIGLTAGVRREDGSEHVVAAWEILLAEGSDAARHLAAYRKWLGLGPAPASPVTATMRRPRRHKAADDDLDLEAPIELVVLAPKDRAARCRVLGTTREITLRSSGVWDMVPAEIITVRARKKWRYAGHPYLSGEVERHRLDVAALGLVPLRLLDEWIWDPMDAYWGEEGEPLEDWAVPMVARGPRPSFEMEQVLPGQSFGDWDSDPILEACDVHNAGDVVAARTMLVEMLVADLRCLDAHAHLGNFAFDHDPELALRHYEAGVRIGELSLGDGFDGVLPWGRIDNRPFLRCMQGFGVCLWRLGRLDDAAAVFERMLWLNPTDNQGMRSLLPEVRAGKVWEDDDGNG